MDQAPHFVINNSATPDIDTVVRPAHFEPNGSQLSKSVSHGQTASDFKELRESRKSARVVTKDVKYASSTTEETSRNTTSLHPIQLRLLNCGSVARDHLALERTYLAYVRTSLGLGSAGVALMQFLLLGHTTKRFAKPVGASLVAIAIITLALGARRYFTVQRNLVDGRFQTAAAEISLITFSLSSVVAITVVLMIIRSMD
ncbi:hypothetical protein CPB83DRAFT_861018 [Crepidotus variabilis]|uniref:DUF202 domain-containing protein n=1 Tax=Crepidotus variabilis TaxID=179855 RepID=A0A9P6JL86_9AGAR|nr:hypothetical protein CPB83DRAFT_861018 [Crepidotus variabilis]